MRLQPFSFALLAASAAITSAQDTADNVSFQQDDGRLVISVNDMPITSYVYHDKKIPRPYFAHVKAPGGTQVSRNHPPVPEKDRTDHDTMHPGIWMAFGDLDGTDFWRNKARIKHVEFEQQPKTESGIGSFVELKHYVRPDNSVVCQETFRCSFRVQQGGYLLTWDSTFSSDNEFYFGDQEEMGIGIRVATPVNQMNGGTLRDSTGRVGASQIWSQSADWCDYSGEVDGKPVGMTLMCHPDNFRNSWMHARNYGFVAANPFGREAMKKGAASKVGVRPGEDLRLQYAVWIHSGAAGEPPAIDAAYRNYVKASAESP
ncbi:MAG: PmoA family protein [Fuerstiella sp.]|nr:PmoA family protein [Fuerstiella sp.]